MALSRQYRECWACVSNGIMKSLSSNNVLKYQYSMFSIFSVILIKVWYAQETEETI